MSSSTFQNLLLAAGRRHKSGKRNQSGFTLVELLIVVVIIGILSAVGIPAYLNQADKAKENAAKSGAANAGRACVAALAAGETYTIADPVGGTCATSNSITFNNGNGWEGSVDIGADGSLGAATASKK